MLQPSGNVLKKIVYTFRVILALYSFTAVNRVYRRGGCRSDLGIAKMRELFKKGRKGVPKTGILITDGDPQEAYKSQAEASAAYKEGVNLFLLGRCLRFKAYVRNCH